MTLIPSSIKDAIDRATRLESRIDQGIYRLNSPSGTMGRALMNNLGELLSADLRYLEVGTERGVAYVSVMNGHSPKYSCVIDPWPNDWLKDDFDENVNTFLPHLRYDQLNLILEDCFAVDIKRIRSRINFYFYDAMHDHDNQRRAFTHFNDLFDETFLTVVDDWNDPAARSGTFAAFKDLGYRVLFEQQIPTEYWDAKGGAGNPNTFWNGLGVFLIEKPAPKVITHPSGVQTIGNLFPTNRGSALDHVSEVPNRPRTAPTSNLFNLTIPPSA